MQRFTFFAYFGPKENLFENQDTSQIGYTEIELQIQLLAVFISEVNPPNFGAFCLAASFFVAYLL